MIPGGGPKGMFGATDGSDHHEVQRLRRLGFVALFGYEQAAVRWRASLSKLLCLFVPEAGGRWGTGHHSQRAHAGEGRYFSEGEINGRLHELGWLPEERRWRTDEEMAEIGKTVVRRPGG